MRDAIGLHANDRRYGALAEHGGDMIVGSSPDGRIVYISRSVENITGFSAEELIGGLVADLTGADTALALQAAWRDRLDQPDSPARYVEYAVEHKDGRTVWLESRPTAWVDGSGQVPVEVVDIVRDITARKLSEQAREAAEDKLEFANVLLATQMEASPNGVMVVDVDQSIVSCNRNFVEMWDLDVSKLIGNQHQSIIPSLSHFLKTPDAVRNRVEEIYSESSRNSRDTLRLKDGRTIDCYTRTLYTSSGINLGRAWFYHDVTDREKRVVRANELARQDPLTGLPNRLGFIEALVIAIARVRVSGAGLAVFYIDLDNFKDVNDTLGHPAGDELLRMVSARLQINLRSADSVARFGGDEFAIIIDEVSTPTEAASFAAKLVDTLAEPYMIGGQNVYSGASIGVELYNPAAPDAETLLSHADLARYRAKAVGRGSYMFFEAAMETDVRTRVRMASDLKMAINGGSLYLVYQPQIAVATKTVIGLEALLRWSHPEHGSRGPAVFIPVAEQMGLIPQLGQWVLAAACEQTKAWRKAGALHIRTAVNVSSLQFRSHSSLADEIQEALRQNGLTGEALELELTESVLLHASKEHTAMVEKIRDTGVTIAIDDFGTGFSSLNYLRRFPVDRIKIAQAFINDLGKSSGDAAIVKATIGLARDLGIKVIAEGVETREQFEMLRDWGCEEVQGYFFSRPVGPEQAAHFLQQPGGAMYPIKTPPNAFARR